MKRKKIRTLKIRGVPIKGVPRDEHQRFIWEVMGYKQLPTGEWYNPVPVHGLSPDDVREYPHGHVCKACRSLFRSKKYHDAYCGSCRGIMEHNKTEIEEKILKKFEKLPPGSGRMALEAVLEALKCADCGWQANEGRHRPENVGLIREYLDDWVVAGHLHWMRHNFWNRFPSKPKFVSKDVWEKHEVRRRFLEALSDGFRKHPPVIEIPYPEQPESEMGRSRPFRNAPEFLD